jgi:hypothetical protein
MLGCWVKVACDRKSSWQARHQMARTQNASSAIVWSRHHPLTMPIAMVLESVCATVLILDRLVVLW